MVENQGDRPEEPTAGSDPQTTPDSSSAAPAAAPAARSDANIPPAPAMPAQGVPAWAPQRPAQPSYPQGAYATAPTQPYGQHPQGAYAGQSFGVGGQHTQPTVPLAPRDEAAPRKKSNAGKVASLIVAAALVGGFAGLGGAYVGVQSWGGSASSPAAAPSTVTVNDPDNVNATTAIAAKVVPSVVTISASGGNSGGTGSGVILSEDGYVVTNTHVVTLDGATGDATIRATTSDGRVYDAEIVGTDPTYDLAVIKLKDASGLTPIDFADSSDLNVGDETVAIGAPLGLSNTVTTGIVSALNRSIEVASSAAPDDDQPSEGQDQGGSGESPFRFDFGQGEQGGQAATETIKIAVIQTDAAINPGNSGGALVDDQGRLIGINVAIASAGSSSGGGQSGSIGVGFAIPSDVAQRVANEIIDNGEATHGLLGASVQSTSTLEDSSIVGAYIADVSQGGPAEKAGLEKGDIVTSFNGLPITSSVDLTAQVRALPAGATTTVTYVRDGQTRTADVTLDAFTS
ncbi:MULTISPECIES: trypsin-like peptidase domain-containing protein [unclassified Microbacterium]|uniref:S1C family serine protease n=1 Tax=unclassified Microbacterium TaxID=2609290 RepID=UPI003746A7F9